MSELRRMFLDRIIHYSFIAQNKMIDKIFLENGIPMSELGQKIIAEVRAKAAADPEYLYPRTEAGGCSYLRNGQPSCIVGHALWNLGLIDAQWKGDDLGISDISHIINHEGWELTIGEIDWLSKVQDNQDNGWPWGQSVARADGSNRFNEDV